MNNFWKRMCWHEKYFVIWYVSMMILGPVLKVMGATEKSWLFVTTPWWLGGLLAVYFLILGWFIS